MKKFTFKTLLAAAALCVGSSAWADVIETVGTKGSGDPFESREYSSAVELALGETFHYTFTNTSYGSNNWNNWLLDIKASSDTSENDWYLTMRSDNYGWGTSYNSTMRSADFVWSDFQTVMNGATVDMYINYNSGDKIIRTYATITKGETEWHYNFATKAIDAGSVYLFLSEELAVLEITTAEKVTSIPDGIYNIYQRSITNGYGYTWDTNSEGADYTGWTLSNSNGTKTLDLTNGLQWTMTDGASDEMITRIFPNSDDIINLEADFILNCPAGSTAERPNEAYFRFGNIYIYDDGQYNQASYVLDGTTTCESGKSIGTVFNSGTYRGTDVSFKVVLEINTKTNVLNSMKVYTHGNNDTPKLTLSDLTLINPDYTTIGIGYIRKRTNFSGTVTVKLQNINVTTTHQNVTYANYTVHFNDNNGNKVKEDDTSRSGIVGNTVNANGDDKTTFYANDCKYVYSSDGDGVTVRADGSAEFTVVYTKNAKYTATASAVNSGTTLQSNIASATVYADETAYMYIPEYVQSGETWYVTEADYQQTAAEAGNKEIEYSSSAIDYFFEVEDMSPSGYILGGEKSNDASYSSGGGACLSANATLTSSATVAAGIYTVSARGIVRSTNRTALYKIYYSTDNSTWYPTGKTISFQTGSTSGAAQTQSITDVVVPSASYIRLVEGGNYNAYNYLDYITLTKTADLPSTETIQVTSVGFATYVSNYNLNFTSATTKAYKVSVEDQGVATLTEVDQVPAKTPVLLYCKGGNGEGEAIAVITSEVSAVTSNDLIAGTGATVATIDGEYTNMILNNVDDKIGFYFANGNTVASNRAYLHIASDLAPDAEETNARMRMVFADDITGVEAIKATEAADNGVVYNLAGQRVAAPTKGLYIVNGKKILVK